MPGKELIGIWTKTFRFRSAKKLQDLPCNNPHRSKDRPAIQEIAELFRILSN